MLCPYCGSRIPDGSETCFICGEPLSAAPINDYYTNLDNIKETDEKLYNELTEKPKVQPKLMKLIIISSIVYICLMAMALDWMSFLRVQLSSSSYEQQLVPIVKTLYVGISPDRSKWITTDAVVAYYYGDEILTGTVKAAEKDQPGDMVVVHVDSAGRVIRFVFSFWDKIESLILTVIEACIIYFSIHPEKFHPERIRIKVKRKDRMDMDDFNW